MFKRISGKPKIEYYPVTPSTAYTNGQVMELISGLMVDADTTSGDLTGILMKDIAATDGDYADSRKVPVDVPGQDDIFQADVGTGTLLTTMIGLSCDLADTENIDVDATSKEVVLIVGYIDASTALVKISGVQGNRGIATT